MKGVVKVPLGNGVECLIDEADAARVSEFSWHYHKSGYATRTIRGETKKTTIRMHRFIMNAPPRARVDHKNGNKLDNRRCNLALGDALADDLRQQIRDMHQKTKWKYRDLAKHFNVSVATVFRAVLEGLNILSALYILFALALWASEVKW